ncbi:MAG: hypothetical protein AAGK17_11660 [Pseudomonadota bacterium]
MRAILPFLLLYCAGPALAENVQGEDDARAHQQIALLTPSDPALEAAKADLFDCEQGCLTPAEAATLAFSAGEGAVQKGRVLLDIRGGGQSLQGNLGELFFVNSHQDYAELGTLTIAFEARVLRALLRRARTCGGALVDGEITVEGCRGGGIKDVNMFTMMQALHKRRIVVEGDIRLQWIDASFGLRSPVSNKRGEFEKGYFQP